MPTQNIARAFADGISRNIGIEVQVVPPTCTQVYHMGTADSKFVDQQLWQNYGPPSLKIPLVPVVMNEAQQSFGKRYIFPTFASGDVISEEDWDDDKYRVLHQLLPAAGGGMARAFKTFYDRTHANLFINLGYVSGTSTPGSPDGYCLFSTSHPTSANISTPIANRPSVDVDFSIAAYQAAKVNMETQYESNGYSYLDNVLRKIVVHSSLQYVAAQILYGKPYQPFSNNFTPNIIADEKVQLVVWPYFQKSGSTGTNNAWFGLGKTHYLQSFMRKAYKVHADYSQDIMAFKWTCAFRFGLGWSDFRGTFGSTGS